MIAHEARPTAAITNEKEKQTKKDQREGTGVGVMINERNTQYQEVRRTTSVSPSFYE